MAYVDDVATQNEPSNTPLGQGHNDLATLVFQLDKLVTKEWQSHPVAYHADESNNVVRVVYHNNDELLEKLFHAAQAALAGDKALAQTISCSGDSAANFRRRIIPVSPTDSRAKILATILSLGPESLLQVWERLQKCVTCGDPAFTDRSLPFHVAQMEDLLGHEFASQFCRAQHVFCPIDRAKLDINFYTPLRDLRSLIDAEATFKCENVDEKGELQHEATDEWISPRILQTLFIDHRQLVMDLCIGLQRIQHGDLESFTDQRLRDHYAVVMENAMAFYKGLRSRETIFAILMFSSILGDAPDWENFMRVCIDASNKSQAPALSDNDLPFTYSYAQKTLRDHKSFYITQFRFCPIRLRSSGELESTWRFEEPPPLPLLDKVFIAEDRFGRIYRVRVAAGYYSEREDQTVAMKVIASGRIFHHDEWRIAPISSKSRTDHINLPEACVITESNTYYFMPLADFDLAKLMADPKGHMETKRTANRRTGVQVRSKATGGLYEDDLEDHYDSLRPRYLEDRRTKLQRMKGLAQCFRNLHDKTPRHSIFHGDVKAKNILYVHGREDPLHLSTFGISMDKDAQPYVRQEVMAYAQPSFSPESDTISNLHKRVDIWAFGSVIAESVVWSASGSTAQYDGLKFDMKSLFDNLIARTEGNEKRIYNDYWGLLSTGLFNRDPNKRLNAHDLCRAVGYLRAEPEKVEALLENASNRGLHYSGNEFHHSYQRRGRPIIKEI